MQTFQNILVDVDATAALHPAFTQACDLAVRSGARMTLVDVMPELPPGADNVVTRHGDQAIFDARSAQLAALAQSRPEVRISTAVLRGKPAVALVQQVLRGRHDLAVRAHARDLVPGRLFGAVDLQLLRNCPCPVWLIGPDGTAGPPRILAAVDVQPHEAANAMLNQTILDLALTMGEAWHGQITLLHAWSIFGEEFLRSRMDDRLEDVLETARLTAMERLASLVASFSDRAAGVRIECIKGDPATLIPAFASRHGIDMVVMGTVARTGLAGFLMGNTAETVLRALRGSVLAVKPPGFVTPVTIDAGEELVLDASR